MKLYKYEPRRYLYAVIAPTIFMFGLLIYAIINNLKTHELNIYTLIVIVTVYGIFNNVISLSNPNKIIDDGEYVEFHSFGRNHRYSWKEIEQIRIKEFYGKKMYLRIGNSNMLKGRYWIKTAMFNDGDELHKKITDLEKKLHPNRLKFRSRKVSSQSENEKRNSKG